MVRQPPLPITRRTIAGATALGVVLTILHGYTPFSISALISWVLSVGSIRCGALSLTDLMHARCAVIGGTSGAEVGNGWPLITAGALLVRLTPLSAEWAYTLLAVVMMSAGVLGTVRLAERFGLRRPYAFLAAVFYLLSPTLFGMTGFGSTFWGMVLIPTAIWLQLSAAELMARRVRAIVPVALVWGAGCFVLLALDGYAYLMAQSATVLLLLLTGTYDPPARRWRVAVPAYVVANVLGFGLYHLLSPANLSPVTPIDQFRASGLDLVTLVRPTSYQWWSPSSIRVDHLLLWGDGTNSQFNYVGVAAAVLAVIGLVCAVRRRSALVWWGVIAVLSLSLSFGPSLKFDEVRGPLPDPVTAKSYLMPAGDAVTALPTQLLYEHAPGFKIARATYRWFNLTRLAQALLLAAGLEELARGGRRRRTAALALGVLALVELSPALPQLLRDNVDKARDRADINRTVVEPLDRVLSDGARVLLTPNAYRTNAYLSGYLATGAHLWMYNVGVDKALSSAMTTWPEDVRVLLTTRQNFRVRVERVLREGLVDAVVVPRFDLRWDIESWPPSEANIKRGDQAIARLRTDPALMIRDLGRVAVVTLRSP